MIRENGFSYTETTEYPVKRHSDFERVVSVRLSERKNADSGFYLAFCNCRFDPADIDYDSSQFMVAIEKGDWVLVDESALSHLFNKHNEVPNSNLKLDRWRENGWVKATVYGPYLEIASSESNSIENDEDWFNNDALTLKKEDFRKLTSQMFDSNDEWWSNTGYIPIGYLDVVVYGQIVFDSEQNQDIQLYRVCQINNRHTDLVQPHRASALDGLKRYSFNMPWKFVPSASHNRYDSFDIRFTPFVTSGCEQYFLGKVSDAQKSSLVDSVKSLIFGRSRPSESPPSENIHAITYGPKWKIMDSELIVHVKPDIFHKEWLGLRKYMLYQIQLSNEKQFVYRRYTHFVMLHGYLTKKYPMIVIPPLPQKQNLFSNLLDYQKISESQGNKRQFEKIRALALKRWVERIIGHPVLTKLIAISIFLTAGQVEDIVEREMDRVYELQEKSAKEFEMAMDQCIRNVTHENRSLTIFYDGQLSGTGNGTLNPKRMESGHRFFHDVQYPEYNLPPDPFPTSFPAYYSKERSRSDPNGYPILQDCVWGRPDDSVTGGLQILESHYQSEKLFGSRVRNITSSLIQLQNNYKQFKQVETSLSELFGNLFNEENCNCKQCTKLSKIGELISEGYSEESNSLMDQMPEIIEWIHEWSSDQGSPIKDESGVDSNVTLNNQIRMGYLNSIVMEGSDLGRQIVLRANVPSGTGTFSPSSPATETFSPSTNGSKDKSIVSNDQTQIPPAVPDPIQYLSRLETIYNVVHSEHDYWFHHLKIKEWISILQNWVQMQVDASNQRAKLWNDCNTQLMELMMDTSDSSECMNENKE